MKVFLLTSLSTTVYLYSLIIFTTSLPQTATLTHFTHACCTSSADRVVTDPHPQIEREKLVKSSGFISSSDHLSRAEPGEEEPLQPGRAEPEMIAEVIICLTDDADGAVFPLD